MVDMKQQNDKYDIWYTLIQVSPLGQIGGVGGATETEWFPTTGTDRNLLFKSVTRALYVIWVVHTINILDFRWQPNTTVSQHHICSGSLQYYYYSIYGSLVALWALTFSWQPFGPAWLLPLASAWLLASCLPHSASPPNVTATTLSIKPLETRVLADKIHSRSSCDTEYATATDKYTGFPGDTGRNSLFTEVSISECLLLNYFFFRFFSFKVCGGGQSLPLHSDQVKSYSLLDTIVLIRCNLDGSYFGMCLSWTWY